MPGKLPAHLVQLIDKKTFAHLATVMPDGSPQVSPIWIDHEGGYIVINSAKGRVKDRNIRKNSTVAISMVDPDNPYQFAMVRGRVVEITEKSADQHIDRMAKKYLGKDKYPFRSPTEVRVIYKVLPDRVCGS